MGIDNFGRPDDEHQKLMPVSIQNIRLLNPQFRHVAQAPFSALLTGIVSAIMPCSAMTDASRQTNDQSHAKAITGTVGEIARQPLLTQTGDRGNDDGGAREPCAILSIRQSWGETPQIAADPRSAQGGIALARASRVGFSSSVIQIVMPAAEATRGGHRAALGHDGTWKGRP